MSSRIGRWMSLMGAAAFTATLIPIATPAEAQGRGNSASCWGREGRDRARCERDRGNVNWDRNRRDWERERRKDAKTDGIVAGVVGTAILGGIIAAAASSSKNRKRDDRGSDYGDRRNDYGDRRSYCASRYGNYDERTDSYRASDGRWYRCE